VGGSIVLPRWRVHRLWARRLDVSDEVSEEVDRIIDFGKEFRGYKIGHDWIKGSIGRFALATELFYREFGVEGVKAMMLHGVLDYMDSLLKMGYGSEEILWRCVAWVKFAGAKHVIHYVSHLPEKERLPWVLNQDYSYRYFGELANMATSVAKELVSFVMKNFNEILSSIKASL